MIAHAMKFMHEGYQSDTQCCGSNFSFGSTYRVLQNLCNRLVP